MSTGGMIADGACFGLVTTLTANVVQDALARWTNDLRNMIGSLRNMAGSLRNMARSSWMWAIQDRERKLCSARRKVDVQQWL